MVSMMISVREFNLASTEMRAAFAERSSVPVKLFSAQTKVLRFVESDMLMLARLSFSTHDIFVRLVQPVVSILFRTALSTHTM